LKKEDRKIHLSLSNVNDEHLIYLTKKMNQVE